MDRKYWEKIAPEYNEEIFDVLKNDSKKIIVSAIKKVSSKNKTVIDIGCAIGKWLPVLSPIFKKVYAVDISKENLEIARKLYPEFSNVEYDRIDMSDVKTRMPLCDAGICINAILTDYEVVFARAAHDELVLGHGRSLADFAHFEQVFVPFRRSLVREDHRCVGDPADDASSDPEGKGHAADQRPAALAAIDGRGDGKCRDEGHQRDLGDGDGRRAECLEEALDDGVGLCSGPVGSHHHAERGEVEGLRDRQGEEPQQHPSKLDMTRPLRIMESRQSMLSAQRSGASVQRSGGHGISWHAMRVWWRP